MIRLEMQGLSLFENRGKIPKKTPPGLGDNNNGTVDLFVCKRDK